MGYFKNYFVFLVVVALVMGGIESGLGQRLPPKKKTLEGMRVANDYFMHKWTDVGKPIVTERTRPSSACRSRRDRGRRWPASGGRPAR